VCRFAAGLAIGGTVLDVACGSGRNFPPLLAAGCRVLGIDRDIGQAGQRWGSEPRVALIAADLEHPDGEGLSALLARACQVPGPADAREAEPRTAIGGAPAVSPPRFAGVVVTNYLWRPLFPELVSAVADDGLLVYETFRQGHERLGRPRRPEFLLRPGELLELVAGRMQVIAFEAVRLAMPDRLVERIAAVGPAHRWAATDAPVGSIA
jgi:SAM-dependent methyltransferase